MKTILFAGYPAKHELLLYMGKLLASLGARTLVVDATLRQSYKYIVPAIKDTHDLTEFEGFDVAFSLHTIHEAKSCLSQKDERLEAYDYILVDMDTEQHLHAWDKWHQQYLISGLDRVSLATNALMLEAYFSKESTGRFHTVVYPYVHGDVDESHIQSELQQYPAEWGETVTFLLDERDCEVGIKNQLYNRISMKGLSRHTRKSLASLCRLVSGEAAGNIRKAFRQAERRRG
ncbi:hypothetical protein [Paenibacillus harenae]|uniref:Uncharacterized protein n=1 Tax=Paenibacillus harenae TaxID=306543 RepID=A0ABT9TTJ0_PAEHA|nr:hypothetical protein [Paenibacillus harenae]MDQ0110658.1 hypothetical protein [Paenibacillus harenae]